ncbi:MAG: molybdenum cofactor guanylyltransferase, partial [FCB group bacterium]|nr:molybdenum cofactor guanylyltransferase [FCB group bacterium]
MIAKIKNAICGAILAGGKSKRMGENKALLRLGEQTLIEHAVKILSCRITRPLIITNTHSDYSFLKLPVHYDIIKNIGPLGGIHTALTHCNASHCLILACDLPFISEHIINQLCTQDLDYDIIAVDIGNGAEPLCAVYGTKCLPEIKEQIEKGDYQVRKLFS